MLKLLLRSLALSLLATAALSQIRVPAAHLLSQPLGTLSHPLDDAASRAVNALSEVRHIQIQQLVRGNPRSIDTDSRGNPVVRDELLALAPDEAALDRARTAGFRVLREELIESLQLRVLVLGAPHGILTRKALRLLKSADTTGAYDFNHIYFGSAAADLPAAPAATNTDSAAQPDAAVRIGLLDTGIDARHEALRASRIHQWGCDGKPLPAAHGTAVASLLSGQAAGFRGVHPGAELYSADVYCGQPSGGAVDVIVAALGWMAEQRVPVINVSLVGPPNLLLERAVAALVSRGFVLVAAVGNDGPAAPPLYPASYPHVVGVTAVDAHHHALIEAARGAQVMFAAPGADMAAADMGGRYRSVRGTSFAAPIVAALLATHLSAPDPTQADAAIGALAQSAIHVGSRGRDLTYGLGLVGEAYRTEPASLIHR